MAAGSRMKGDASPSSQQSPKGAQHTLGDQSPQGRAAGDTATGEGPQGAPALLCWPQHASPSSWLALEPRWLPARRPQCSGRKKKQLCFALSLAINQVPISSQLHVPHPKCTRQLPSHGRAPTAGTGFAWQFRVNRELRNEIKVQ